MPDIPPPVDFGWFSERQYEHLMNAIDTPHGMPLVTSYCAVVRQRVEICREMRLTPGHTIRVVLRQTRAGYPGIDHADLVPITRGILTAIFEEQSA
jgi:hypothetical protein